MVIESFNILEFIRFFNMYIVSVLFIAFSFLTNVERSVIGRFYDENSLDTNYVKESNFENVLHYWITQNQNTEHMYVNIAKRCFVIPVRQLKSFRYLI